MYYRKLAVRNNGNSVKKDIGMVNRSFFVLLIFFFTSASVSAAELRPWYKEILQKDNPNSLGYYAHVAGSCALNKAELDKVVEGVFIRSRIKPADSFGGPLYLYIRINCLPSFRAFAVTINFGRFLPHPPILYDRTYGTVGTSDNDPNFILNVTKSFVEDAITDYISANFDL